MMQWNALFQKETTESWRNRKLIWVPLVFMLIAVMDPLTYHFLPQIIEFSGGLPEGAVFEFPEMQPAEVALTSLQSLSTYGIIILALFTMGSISSEQKSGVNEMILVRPINYGNYISAKWAANLLLVIVSLILSVGLSWYYINLLFGNLSFKVLFFVLLMFTLWFALFLSISIFYNVLLKMPGAVAACTVATYFLMSAGDMIVGNRWPLYPNQIFVHTQHMLINETVTAEIWGMISIMVLLIALLITMAIIIFRRKTIAK
ncbi:ABC transporter permease [Virgibacillus sp. W0181]|uniref:ABC transporter permease n=1 Tax=Virgibacillus sp. W0181 TaxID=3391581 RepID=UPI003F46FA61